MEDRIQKIIAAAGIASRRAAEELIVEGRVRVNGAVVTELGAKADPERDHIKVDGKLINPKQPKTYLMLNKPAGCVTTMFDPEGRPTVTDLLKRVRVRVYPVGRLDYDTEGLLLLTNDGDFAFRVTHPSHELPKTYQVKVKGVLEDRQIEHLEQGVFLKDGRTAPARVRKLRKEESNSWIEITIHEGRKRQVRRMIDHTGHSVIKLKRVRIGNLNLGDLPLGSFRYLTSDEVKALQDMAQGGDGVRPIEDAKPSRRPAASGHVPEFIEGPRPAVRVPKKEYSRSIGAPRFSRSAASGDGPQRTEGRDRTYEKKTGRPEQRSERQDSRDAAQGDKRIARPSYRDGDRTFVNKAPRTDDRPGPGRRPGRPSGDRTVSREQGVRPFVGRTPRTGDRSDARKGPGRSFDSRPLSREQGDRPFVSRAPRTGERSDAQRGRGPGRPFPVSRTRSQERGARPDGAASRPAGRTEWRRDGRSRGPAPFVGERGPRKARPSQGASDRPRSRPGVALRPAEKYPRGPKGPARRRS